jgi:type II secretory pathway pseudopilin PulG
MSQKRSQRNSSVSRLFTCLKSAMYPAGPQRRLVQRGYTIIEVMIFLAVTGAMFAIVMRTFSGQQARAEFNTAVREVESKFQDVINNVGSGLYSNNGNIQCILDGPNNIKLIDTTTTQGTNTPCIYIGQMIHFAPAGNRSMFNIYSVAGKRVDAATGREISDIAESQPMVIARGPSPPFNGCATCPDTTDTYTIPPGLTIARVTYNDTGTWVDTGSMGFFTTFSTYNTTGSLQSGSQTSDLVVIKSPPAPGLDTNKENMVMHMDLRLDTAPEHIKKPSNGVKVCFEGDSTDQVAVFTISGNQFTAVKVDVYEDIAAAIAAGQPC